MSDLEELDDVLEECAYCGERLPPDQFEDGLRCKTCAEEQDEGPSQDAWA